MKRVILLADMNSFFASCHQAVYPHLLNEKVVVCGDPGKRRGIVLAASYPAKELGIKTGMPLWEAKKLCPDGYYFKPDYGLYVHISSLILKIMRDFTDLVEPFSIDEAFADMTGTTNLWGAPVNIAVKLKQRIKSEVGVLCSIGAGPNKLVAKMAADLEKPDGLIVIKDIEDFKKLFWPMPVRKLFGIGPRYEKHLKNFNVRTIGDLANLPVEILKKRWGKNGEMLWYLANGIDNSPVVPTTLCSSKSIGHQRTLPKDISGFEIIKIPMLELSEKVARRARQGGYSGRTVTLTLRDAQLRFFSSSQSMTQYTNLGDEIYDIACRILHNNWEENRAVRLVGITLSNLVEFNYFQHDIFGRRVRLLKLARACDNIKERFGETTVIRGGSLLI